MCERERGGREVRIDNRADKYLGRESVCERETDRHREDTGKLGKGQ